MSLELPLKFAPGKLIVFEGLDNTGKSTQLERFERATHTPALGDSLYEPKPMFTHQPSGASGIGPEIYALTERIDWSQANQLTRQLLNLAAHVEHYRNDISPALERSSVFLDRCWWSTVAYGYRDEVQARHSFLEWVRFCLTPATKLPDIVFLFEHQFLPADSKDTADSRTLKNYKKLARHFDGITVHVPKASVGETQAFISGQLYSRGFVQI